MNDLNKLADALAEIAFGDRLAADMTDVAEAAALLRAAAGADVAGLMEMVRRIAHFGFMKQEESTALESALCLLVAQAGLAASSAPQAVPDEIRAIIERLHTQDNRITDNPLFAVQQKRRIGGVDTEYCENSEWVLDGEVIHLEPGQNPPQDARRVGYIDKWEFVTGCFTEQGCKDFIACNGHNLNEPRIYAYGSYRNAEFIALRKWLMSLAAAPSTQPVPAPSDLAATVTPKPQPGEWSLIAPDGRMWTADSPLRCVSLEQRERVPADVAMARILDAAYEPVPAHVDPTTQNTANGAFFTQVSAFDPELQCNGYGVIDPDYARAFTMIRSLAWSEGYAITLHGSFTRDLDLVAIPWAERVCAPEHLVRRIADATGLKSHASNPGIKPHGRKVWTLNFPKGNDPRWVDLSFVPSTASEKT